MFTCLMCILKIFVYCTSSITILFVGKFPEQHNVGHPETNKILVLHPSKVGMTILVDQSGRVFTKGKCTIKDILVNKEVWGWVAKFELVLSYYHSKLF